MSAVFYCSQNICWLNKSFDVNVCGIHAQAVGISTALQKTTGSVYSPAGSVLNLFIAICYHQAEYWHSQIVLRKMFSLCPYLQASYWKLVGITVDKHSSGNHRIRAGHLSLVHLRVLFVPSWIRFVIFIPVHVPHPLSISGNCYLFHILL